LRDRRERQAEKIRSEEARAKMSAKRLQRMKKVSGRCGQPFVRMTRASARADDTHSAPRSIEEDQGIVDIRVEHASSIAQMLGFGPANKQSLAILSMPTHHPPPARQLRSRSHPTLSLEPRHHLMRTQRASHFRELGFDSRITGRTQQRLSE